jgi:proton-translocating NADH-quinone oxidoreductase chain N
MGDWLLVWLIWLPLAASPAVYLFGRLFGQRLNPFVKYAGLLGFVASWVPFVMVYQQFQAEGPLTFTLGAVALRLDGVSLLLTAVILALATVVTLYSGPMIAGEIGEEKYYAMLLAMSGVMIGLGCAADLFNLWLWFEGIAVTSFLLVVFHREEVASLEAGLKYLVQSAVGSAMVLMGIAIVLGNTGTLDLVAIQAAVQGSANTGMLLVAAVLFVIGFGVKVSLVPLHTWLPDAHAQAPSGISAMLSGVVIEAALIALLRVVTALAEITAVWGQLLMIFGALNMLVGNLMALRQKMVKRMLAFSSVAHVGYMLVGLGIAIQIGDAAGAQGSFFHLLSHGLMKGLAFLAVGALMFVLFTSHGHEPLYTKDMAGAAQRYPMLAFALSLAVLGLAGLPPLVGFMSKWQILVAGFATNNAWIYALVAFVAVNSVLSLGYYAPLVNMVYRREPSSLVLAGRTLPMQMALPIVLLLAAIVLLGVWPSMVQGLVEPAGAALMGAFN